MCVHSYSQLVRFHVSAPRNADVRAVLRIAVGYQSELGVGLQLRRLADRIRRSARHLLVKN